MFNMFGSVHLIVCLRSVYALLFEYSPKSLHVCQYQGLCAVKGLKRLSAHYTKCHVTQVLQSCRVCFEFDKGNISLKCKGYTG